MTLIINNHELKNEETGPLDFAYALMSRAKVNVVSDIAHKKVVFVSNDIEKIKEAISIAEEFII